MRALLLSTGLLLSAIRPVLAQAPQPWTTIYELAGSQYNAASALQVNSNGSAWVLYHEPKGMGVSGYGIAATSDNGATWQLDRQGFHTGNLAVPPSGTDYVSVWGITGQEAWAITYGLATTTYSLAHTTTGPAGFAPVPAQVGTPRQVHFFSPSVGVVVGSGTAPVYRTTDGGQSWQPIPLAASFAASDLSASYGQHFWILAANGQLAQTTDAGATWTLSTSPALTSLAFRDDLHGLGVRYAQNYPTSTTTVYRTADGGLTWQPITPSGACYSAALLAVPGSPGTYLSSGDISQSSSPSGTAISYDDGSTWQSLSSTQSVSFLAIDAAKQVWGLYASYVRGSVQVQRLGSGVALAASLAQAAPDQLAYPNPTTGLLHLPAAGPFRHATVFDLAGRQCRSVSLGAAATTLDLSDLGAGSYSLRLAGNAAPVQQRITITR